MLHSVITLMLIIIKMEDCRFLCLVLVKLRDRVTEAARNVPTTKWGPCKRKKNHKTKISGGVVC